ncbi:MAG: transcriptional repressor [Rhodocyclaceae bacterium]|jgi:Fur family iron response transcriptional regulator|nr:transcriptional repressor [Rhodocyclaceae bacterium]MCL4757821.1 transcriptional repressor [Rhodocyclaceae bacterium]
MEMNQFRNIADTLRRAGIPVTFQRLEIGRVLLSEPVHLSADQVLARVRETTPETSRATVYNTLKVFKEKKLIRELIVDPERVFYDSSTHPHYHIYDVTTGMLCDLPEDDLKVVGQPVLPPGMELEEVDVIVRVRSKAA